MKKFSVLLLIIVLSVPLIVYGVYGLVSNNNSSKLSIPDEPNSVIKTLDEPTPPDPNVRPKLPNPFYQVMPHGIRGKVANINSATKVIHLKDALYFDPNMQKNELSEYMIYLNDKTNVLKDLVIPARLSDITVGSEIICVGSINFEKHELKYATTIFIGQLVPADFQAELPAEGSIEELDKTGLTFTLDLSSMIEGIGKLKIHITESTKCFEESGTTEEDFLIKEIGMGIIPDYVGDGSFVRAKIRLRYNEADAYADMVSFVKP
jgi:hypothetical protein